jgi:hypothetical protein
METNYTKGEWSIAENHVEHEFKNQFTILSDSTKTICDVARHNYREFGKDKFVKFRNDQLNPDAEAEANAKLISAAPSLLDGCYAAIAIFKSQGIHRDMRIIGDVFKKIEDAINKATI